MVKILLICVVVIVIISITVKLMKKKYDPEDVSLNIILGIENAIHYSLEDIARKLKINRNMFDLKMNPSNITVDEFKVYQSYSFIKAFFVCESLLMLRKINIISKDMYPAIYEQLRRDMKRKISDFTFEVEGANPRREFDGFVDDIISSNYDKETLSNMLQDMIATYFGVKREEIKNFDENYSEIEQMVRDIGWEAMGNRYFVRDRD